MPRRLSAPGRSHDPLQALVDAEFDRHLDPLSTAPLLLGLSGGGDSLALLHLAADWAGRHARPLHALTIDHRLQPDSAAWTLRARQMATEVGAPWDCEVWADAKPRAGIPTRARAFRHQVLAERARRLGAGVVLLGHTLNDVAENDVIRLSVTPAMGRLRTWSPSPVWPEGRRIFLLRPLLHVKRSDLRHWLVSRELSWLDDPANDDSASPRALARAASPLDVEPALEISGFGEATEWGVRLWQRALQRADGGHVLAVAIACAAGSTWPPRSARLLQELRRGRQLVATVGGAWVAAAEGVVTIGRELGRQAPPDQELAPQSPTVWDGRYELPANPSGWRVGVAANRMSALSPSDREHLKTLPARARPAHPVLVRGGEVRLATGARSLIPRRFDAAIGRISTETQLRERS